MNRLLLIPLALFIVLSDFCLLVWRRDPHEVPSPLINKSAPDFQLPALQQVTATSVAKEARQSWLLNFWGTWCVACREEHRLLVQYARTDCADLRSPLQGPAAPRPCSGLMNSATRTR